MAEPSLQMNRCMYGGGGWVYRGAYGPRFARWPGREERAEWLAEYKRDLEQEVAKVADEIRRLKAKPEPAG